MLVPALMHPPQVHTGEGGGALVPLAGVRRAPEGEALHVDLGNPVTPRLTVQRQEASVEPAVPHAACRRGEERMIGGGEEEKLLPDRLRI